MESTTTMSAEFDMLLEVIDTLLGPQGCPWDQQQTLQSMRSSLLEEVYELIEAIDLEGNAQIREELGDVFVNLLLIGRIATKEGRCTLDEALSEERAKLIRRHPHVFGEHKPTVTTTDDVHKLWQEIKEEERGEDGAKESVLKSIPSGLPALMRAQKIVKKMREVYLPPSVDAVQDKFTDEASVGQALWDIVVRAEASGMDADAALRRVLARREKEFRDWEKGNIC